LLELERPQRWQQPPWGMSQEGTLTMDQYKDCIKCGQSKLPEQFHRVSATDLRLRNTCKTCNNASTKSYRRNNKEKNLELTRQWRRNNLDRVATYRKKWKSENPISVSKSNSSYYRKNSEKFTKAQNEWKKKNPEKVALARAAYRARKLLAQTYLIAFKDMIRLKNAACFYCGAAAHQIDHIIPLSRGGNHSIGNLAPACTTCNTSKNNKTVMEWRIWKIKRGENC